MSAAYAAAAPAAGARVAAKKRASTARASWKDAAVAAAELLQQLEGRGGEGATWAAGAEVQAEGAHTRAIGGHELRLLPVRAGGAAGSGGDWLPLELVRPGLYAAWVTSAMCTTKICPRKVGWRLDRHPHDADDHRHDALARGYQEVRVIKFVDGEGQDQVVLARMLEIHGYRALPHEGEHWHVFLVMDADPRDAGKRARRERLRGEAAAPGLPFLEAGAGWGGDQGAAQALGVPPPTLESAFGSEGGVAAWWDPASGVLELLSDESDGDGGAELDAQDALSVRSGATDLSGGGSITASERGRINGEMIRQVDMRLAKLEESVDDLGRQLSKVGIVDQVPSGVRSGVSSSGSPSASSSSGSSGSSSSLSSREFWYKDGRYRDMGNGVVEHETSRTDANGQRVWQRVGLPENAAKILRWRDEGKQLDFERAKARKGARGAGQLQA